MTRLLGAVVLLSLLFVTRTWADAVPRVVVWDPVSSANTGRGSIDAAYLNKVAQWLEQAGVQVQRLTTEQLIDDTVFNAPRFDALLIEGDVVPSRNIEAYRRFTEAGGVLIALNASGAFENKVAQNDKRQWRLDPETPRFAWQTTALHQHFGIHFNHPLDMAYAGVQHTPTELFKKYLPQAVPVKKSMMARWFTVADGTMYPLMRSQRTQGDDYTPQIYLVVHGKRRAIISASAVWTGEADTKLWPHGPATVVALSHLARDLRQGTVDLRQALTVTPLNDVKTTEPLELRSAGTGVEPENARPLIRWGRFDGSRLDLGANLPGGQTRTITAGTIDRDFPGALEAGSTLLLHLPTLSEHRSDQPWYLRLRMAVAVSGPALSVRMGDLPLWNETFLKVDDATVVDLGHGYGGVPTELTRTIFIPSNARSATTLQIHNPGTQTLFFDAIQIEQRTQPDRRMELGLHTGVELAYDKKTSFTPDMVKPWSVMRCTTRTWWIDSPEKADRWKRYDQHVERYLALHPNPQLIFEGTPPWAPISESRYLAGGARKHMTPPDTEKFAQMVERIVSKYADRVADWEIWNEANIRHFWQGSPDEYAQMFLHIAPIVRRLDPQARIIVAGMAGVASKTIDPFVIAMVESDALKLADLLPIHCYAPAGQWDVPYGLVEGHLMSLGSNIEVYPNEQGFTWRGGKPALSGADEADQARLLDIGTARLFASGAAKVTNFNGGGDANDLGIIDENGRARPAYESFSDYLHLVTGGARRMDIAMTGLDDAPLAGVYAAASRHDDGSMTLVINPAEVAALQPRDNPDSQFIAEERGQWNAFFGTSQWEDGKVIIRPAADKDYVGFYRRLVLDPQTHPTLRVVVPQATGRWTLQLKFAGPDNPVLIDTDQPGTFELAYAEKLQDRSVRPVEISFRAHGRGSQLTLDELTFPAPAIAREPVRIGVKVMLPCSTGTTYQVSTPGRPAVQPVQMTPRGSWALVQAVIDGRTVIRLTP